jgi:putative membrane protein
MSHLISRCVLALLVSAGLCLACGSDQKPVNAPETASAPESPSDTSTGAAATPAPNGEPVSTPPQSPPPQGLNETRSGNTVAMPGTATQPQAEPALSESQIAMITDLANTAEIEQAKLAQNKAKSASVKKFAAMMIKHHSQAKTDQAKLYKQLSLTPTQSQDANLLKDDANNTLGTLRGSSGAPFDVAYMDSQVAAHQKVLDTLDQKLIPAASDQRLIDELKHMRETVESHLKEAKSIQADLAQQSSR